jgi:hypothetical protein
MVMSAAVAAEEKTAKFAFETTDVLLVDPKQDILFQPFQFFATRFGEAPQRIKCVFIDHRAEVGKCLIRFRV